MSQSKNKYQNDRRKELLGMPYGTARGRLIRNILFSVLHRHNENLCYVCGELIESVSDLSVEHKEPWESTKNASLFWDTENIAFSHVRCNVPHNRSGGISKNAPEGTKWCNGCQNFLEIGLFSPNPSRYDGKDSACRDCCAARKRERRREQGTNRKIGHVVNSSKNIQGRHDMTIRVTETT